MPGDSEHPVTVGDLYVVQSFNDIRSATVADLVSALRATEGGYEIEIESVHPFSLECGDLPWQSLKAGRYLLVPLEVEVPKDPWDYDP